MPCRPALTTQVRRVGSGDRTDVAQRAAHSITEKLAASEPGKADYRRDLSIGHSKLGNLLRAQGAHLSDDADVAAARQAVAAE